MPRFVQSKYKPSADSSDGCKQEADKDGVVILKMKPEGCPCGCNQEPEGKKSKFRMGHDARLRGKLIRAHLTGTEIRYKVGNTTEDDEPAMDVARRLQWVEYLKKAEARREEKNKQVLKNALGSKRLVKVGRWERTGQVVAVYEPTNGKPETFDIQYVTKEGETKTVKGVPADKTKVPS